MGYFRIEGIIFDVYAPETEISKEYFIKCMSGKVKRRSSNIVLNLDGFTEEYAEEILKQIQEQANPSGALKHLTEILVIKDNKIIWKWTW